MSLPTNAQQIADFVKAWDDYQMAIANGGSWCYKCIEIGTSLVSNPNFSTILSEAQQQWVQQCLTFFNSLPTGLPPQPQ